MEGFSFVDIYSTKGIEYMVAAVFFFGFMFLQIYMNAAEAPAGERSPGFVDYFRVPQGYHFHQGHGWLRPEAGSMGLVGLDDFAQKLVGKVDSIELPKVGSRVVKGEKAWKLVVDAKSIPMLSPADGEVVAVNQEVLRSPDILCQDPYGKGWLFKVKSPKIAADTRHLLTGKVARAWMENALEKLRPINPENLGPVLPDGGLPIDGIARAIGGNTWDAVAREHLLTD